MNTPIECRVMRIESLSSRVKRFTLVPVAGPAPAFSGGSHVGVVLETPAGTIRNFYSLVSSPYDQTCLQIAVQREPTSRGGSAFLHSAVHVGDTIGITPPRNFFPLVRTARRQLLIAGGIGITPFVSQVETLLRWGTPFSLLYLHRGPDAPFLAELRARIGGRLMAHDSARAGRIGIESLIESQPLGTHLAVCGPAALIDTVTTCTRALGWPAGNVHSERFSAGPAAETRPFVAHLARTGVEIPVGADSTLLDALESAGVAVPYSCRIGGCGTCEIPVTAGEIDHRDHCWSADDHADGTRLLACVSRALNGKLVLDL